MIPDGAVALDPVGTAPGLIVPGRRRMTRSSWSCRALRASFSRCGRRRWRSPLLKEVIDRATQLNCYRLRMFGTPESELALSLREIEDQGLDFRRPRDHHLPAQGRGRDRRAVPGRRRRSRPRQLQGRAERAPRAVALQPRRHAPSTRSSPSGSPGGASASPNPAAPDCWRPGSPMSRARPNTSPAGSSPIRTRPSGICSGSIQELLDEFGAVSPEVAEAMAMGALERFEADVVGRDHRDRRSRWRHGGQAGRPRLHFNVRDRARAGSRAAAPVIPGGRQGRARAVGPGGDASPARDAGLAASRARSDPPSG